MSSPSAVNKDEGTGSELGVESIGSLKEPGDAAAASDGDLAFALRTVAEALKAQQKMQEKLCEKITERPDRARVLASVKLPDFDGHPLVCALSKNSGQTCVCRSSTIPELR